MKKIFFIICLFSVNTVFSQNDGTGNTGMSFLKLGVGSRAFAMGEAVSSNVKDASALHYNPSAIMNDLRPNVIFMHNENILGIRSDYLGAKFNVNKLGFGFNVNTTSVNDIEVRQIPGEPTNKFSSRFFSIGISTAYQLNRQLSIGVTGKFLYEKIYIENASGFALDFGGTYIHNDRISIGASISNIGSLSELNLESTKLPALARFGVTYKLPLEKMNSQITISAEGFKVFDGGRLHLHSGIEYNYKDLLFLRAGYQSGYENKFISAGVGISYSGFTLDYSFVPYKMSMGNGHIFTIGKFF